MDVTEDTDELENLLIAPPLPPAAEVAASATRLVASWSAGAPRCLSRLICGVTVAIDPMLRVFTTGCSALARVANRLASRMLLFVTFRVDTNSRSYCLKSNADSVKMFNPIPTVNSTVNSNRLFRQYLNRM